VKRKHWTQDPKNRERLLAQIKRANLVRMGKVKPAANKKATYQREYARRVRARLLAEQKAGIFVIERAAAEAEASADLTNTAHGSPVEKPRRWAGERDSARRPAEGLRAKRATPVGSAYHQVHKLAELLSIYMELDRATQLYFKKIVLRTTES